MAYQIRVVHYLNQFFGGLGGEETILKVGDTIVFLPITAGG